MIYVRRDRVPEPAFLASDEVAQAQGRLDDFFVRPPRSSQQRFDFDESLWLHSEVVTALHGLFANKCAYCESPVDDKISTVVDHFRPLSDAQGLGEYAASPYHYYRLAYSWENLYLVCPVCRLNKGVQFPVAGRRAPVDSKWKDLQQGEKPLLLDPCRDATDKHLTFLDNGTVTPAVRPFGEDQRGQVTIRILGLNRKELVEAREALAARVVQKAESAFSSGSLEARKSAVVVLRRLTDPRHPYAGSAWQVFARQLQELELRYPESPSLADLREIENQIKDAIGGAVDDQPYQGGYPSVLGSVEDTQTAYLSWAHIRNFRAIHDLELSFQFPRDASAGWKVLLGENGFGKSSILQAVALTLIGQDGIDALQLDPAKLLRCRARKGWVKVGLTTGAEPLELHFDRRQGLRAQAEAKRLNPLLIRGYGATRLLPPAGVEPPSAGIRHEVRSLFNPYASLVDAIDWLVQLEPEAFDRAARTLKDLLNLDSGEVLEQKNGRVLIHDARAGLRIELDQLSDGYQSVLALAVDLMAGAPATLNDVQNTPGIVLLDEIGAQLHPRWRMQIVGSLRRAFPKIQFLATTHEPLCLRGLRSGEIEVLRRDAKGEIWTANNVPSPECLRVDQLLTSPLFGLQSTIDQEIEAKFRRYYELLADPEAGDIREARELKVELSGYGALGYTRRDQLVYDAIDDFLAREPRLARKGYEKEWKATRDKVRKIWQWLDSREAMGR